MSDRLSLLHNFPFKRLNALLEGIEPSRSPLFMQIGEPQNAVPDLVAPAVAANEALLGKYPPQNGAPSYLDAVARWIETRYRLPQGSIDAQKQVTALCGTREGLFQAALMAILRKKDRISGNATPAVLVPNPMYHVYFGGAVIGEAEPILVNCVAANDFVPDYESLDPATLDRTAICYLCTPGNPTGTVTPKETISRMLALARKHDFILALDECYSEIWFDAPPAGGFDLVADGEGIDNLIVFNSLSKRSGSPGLRCGFAAGDPALIEPLTLLRSYGGAQVPGTLMAAGEALWRDEAHSRANRARYHDLVTIADDTLAGLPGYWKPKAGFFLWLETAPTLGDGETAAKRLWQEAGVKVLPGRYMSRPDPTTDASPGDGFIRIALVHDRETVRDAMARVKSVLENA